MTNQEKLNHLVKTIDDIADSLEQGNYRYEILFNRFKHHAWLQKYDKDNHFNCIKCQALLEFTSNSTYTIFWGLTKDTITGSCKL